ncbi:hypothetical protein V6N13_088055 [Hibiscus sabdariffa]
MHHWRRGLKGENGVLAEVGSEVTKSQMHPRPKLFHGKFRVENIFPGNKHSLRPFSSDNNPLPIVTELISNQHWRSLKTHLQNANPITLLQQLLDSRIDPCLTLRYYKWSEEEFNLSHSLEHSCMLLHSLANSKEYSKMRSFLYGFVKNENHISVSSIFHAISISGDSFCAGSIIADMLILTYVNRMRSHLGFEAFKRAGDYCFKLSVMSCNPLLSALVKNEKIEHMEYVYKEMIRRRIEVNVISFNTVINGLCKVGKLNKASDAVQDMKAWGILPDVITYNTLIGGYCKKACAMEGVKLYSYNIRAAHVDGARNSALEDAVLQGMSAKRYRRISKGHGDIIRYIWWGVFWGLWLKSDQIIELKGKASAQMAVGRRIRVLLAWSRMERRSNQDKENSHLKWSRVESAPPQFI